MRDRIGKFTTRVSTRASNSRASYRLRRATYGNGRLISDCLEIRRTLRNLPVSSRVSRSVYVEIAVLGKRESA